MDINKKPYEISIWDDVHCYEIQYEDGTIVEIEGALPESEQSYTIIRQYFKEVKLAIIGSNTMSSPTRAFSPKFVQNINGSNDLSFSMLYKYFDNNELVDNPIVKNYMVNERKVKLHYKNEWYDFLIKDIQENSESYTFVYTCKDLHICELSKIGFKTELETELNNNIDTADKLAEKVLEETDWQVVHPGEDIIIGDVTLSADYLTEYTVEPIYRITIPYGTSINITNMKDPSDIISISGNANLFTFYSLVTSNDEPDKSLQVAYTPTGYEYDSDGCIINTKNYIYQVANYTKQDGRYWKPDNLNLVLDERHQGKRLIKPQLSHYDKRVERVVKKYNSLSYGVKYGYEEDEYLSPVILTNYITNGVGFTTTSGWTTNEYVDNIQPTLYPELSSIAPPTSDFYKATLKVKPKSPDFVLYNSGIYDHRARLHELLTGVKYVFRYSIRKHIQGQTETNYDTNGEFTASIVHKQDGEEIPILEFTDFEQQGESNYCQCIAAVGNHSLSYDDLLTYGKDVYIKFECTNSNCDYFYIEDIQFFDYVTDSQGNTLYLDSILNSEIKHWYYFYDPDETATDKSELKIEKYNENPGYEPLYDENCQKMRSITGSESNCFNLLQDISESFEAWVQFHILHNPDTGEILYEDLPNTRRQQKYVAYHEYYGADNYAGFKYGINLKSIARTIDSENIVSKTIIPANSNEYSSNGNKSCNIALAPSNPTGENFILNFKYFYQQGLLDYSAVFRDLYLTENENIGYYVYLREINNQVQNLITKQTSLTTQTNEIDSRVQIYSGLIDATLQEIKEKRQFLVDYCGLTEDDIRNKPEGTQRYKNDDEVRAIIADLVQLESALGTDEKSTASGLELATGYYKQYRDALKIQADYSTELKDIADQLKEFYQQKINLNKQFYSKYARYIQEGIYNDDEQYDDELFYLRGVQVSETSAEPEVEYTINVLELSALEDYENYQFNIGDKTYIEDVEFFGYDYINNIKTPYKEEIIVSSLDTFLDSPESNVIHVQNYKTQFEELFQRIASTTQSLQYAQGSYNRVAGILTTQKTIEPDIVQNSIANNSIILSNAKDQSVRWDSSGITVSSLSAPNQLLRLVSGGVMLSTDGGASWTTGISGQGINAYYINTGALDTSKVIVRNSGFASFRWDSEGINAFRYIIDSDNKPTNFSENTFVRLDQFGLYGINEYTIDGKIAKFSPLYDDDGNPLNIQESIARIQENSDFSVTWNGFRIRSRHYVGENGYIDISTDNDIRVINNNGDTQIKIGLLSTNIYGIQILDNGLKVIYTPTTDTEPQYEKTYYILENGLYITWPHNIGTEFDPNVTYFERSEIRVDPSIVMESDSQGLLWLRNYLRIGPNINNGLSSDQVQFGVIENYSGRDINQKLIICDETQSILSKILSIKHGSRTQIDDYTLIEPVLSDLTAGENLVIYDDGSLFARNATLTGKGQIGSIYIRDGGVVQYIESKQYYQLTDAEKALGPLTGHKYYYLDETGNYIPWENPSSFDQDKDYYEIFTEYENIFSLGLDGLKLYNNSITIYAGNDDGEASKKVLYIDENGNLTFSGILSGASGSFTGNITAQTGTIENYLDIGNSASYIPTTDKTPQPGVQYWIKNEATGDYEEWSGNQFEPDIIYYIKNPDLVYIRLSKYFNNEKNGYIYSSNYTNNDSLNPQGFLIDGNGTIYANNIELGTGAVIHNYLQLGKTQLRNPDYPTNTNRIILDSQGLQIDDTGIISLNQGSIVLDGITGTIYSGENGSNWSISPSLAQFNNAVINGEFHTAVFAKDSLTVRGGAQIFKDGCKIKSIERENDKLIITLETTSIITDIFPSGQENVYVMLTNFNYVEDNAQIFATIEATSSENKSVTVIPDGISLEDIDLTDYNYLIYLGEISNNVFNDWIIGVNSTNNLLANNLLPNSISFNEITLNKNSNSNFISYKTKLILGEIPNNLIGTSTNVSGLYAEAAYLTGTLTTSYSNIGETGLKYAGVNTIGNWQFSPRQLVDYVAITEYQRSLGPQPHTDYYIFNTSTWRYEKQEVIVFDPNVTYYIAQTLESNELFESDQSAIVFWAGALGTTEPDIQKSPFQVTSNGTLYAHQGYFSGSIITRSTISASIIKTAIIEGSGETVSGDQNSAALIIQNANKGILFRGTDSDNNYQPVFSVSTSQLLSNVEFDLNADLHIGNKLNYSYIDNSLDLQNTYFYNHDNYTGKVLGIKDHYIIFYNSLSDVKAEMGVGIDYSLKNNYYFNIDENISMKYSDILITSWSNDSFNVSNNFSLGEFDAPNMEYKKVKNGYDLYVYGGKG